MFLWEALIFVQNQAVIGDTESIFLKTTFYLGWEKWGS